MDKPKLMNRLAMIRAKAEAAHLEIVISTQLVNRLETENHDLTAAKTQLLGWKMAEQKLLRVIWLLDELDKVES